MTMGKAAENELIKLKAAWLSNVSTGLFVGGFAVPYFTAFQKGVETGSSKVLDFAAIATMISAWAVAAIFQWRARRQIRKIMD
jgi:hypothetical protein